MNPLAACGLVMDFVRSCYRTRIKPFADDATEIPIRWFRAAREAGYYPGFHSFFSHNWDDDKFPWDGPGEVYGASRPWDRGDAPEWATGERFCGRAEWFVDGAPFDADRDVPYRSNGAPLCCTGLPMGPGGVMIDGHAFFARARLWITTGGVKIDGAAVSSQAASLVGTGGVVIDGAAKVAVAGGVLIDGAAIFWAAPWIIPFGGDSFDGSAVTFAGAAYLLASGGVLLDGAALTAAGAGLVGSGGVLLDGQAVTIGSPGFADLVGSGGELLDGAGLTVAGAGLVASGGVLLDGAGLTVQGRGLVASGGVLLDGAGLTVQGPGLVASGGVLLDGAAVTAQAAYLIGSGGLFADGAAGSGWGNEMFPKRWMCWHDQAIVTAGSALLRVQRDTLQAYNDFCWQTPAANGDTWTQGVYLKAGTYTMRVLGMTSTDRGKVDWTIDGTSFSSGDDWYTAALARNVIRAYTVTVVGDGWHTLQAKLNGKNAASSGYALVLTNLWFEPATD